jgi:predicted amidohydrolase YtcJ
VSWKEVGTPRNVGRIGIVLACLVGAFVVALNATSSPHVLVAAGVNGPDYAPPTLIAFNGKISTQDARHSVVEAVAFRGDTVLAVGDDNKIKQLAGKETRMIDLGGRRALPGLDDGHLHGLRNAYHCFTNSPRLDNVYTRAEALQVFANKAKHVAPGQWMFITSGWNPKQFSDKPGMFTLAELDAAFPNNPLDFRAAGFNGSQTNSAGLKALGLKAGSPGVTLDAAGNPTGQLTRPAQQAADAQVIQQIDGNSIEVQEHCLEDFIRDANSNGLTGWVDPGGNQQPFNGAGGCLEAMQGLHDHQPVLDMWLNGKLNARVPFYQMIQFSGYEQLALDQRHAAGFLGDDMLRFMGIGEEVECPGNSPLVGASQNVPDLAVDYRKLVDFIASNRMSLQHHASAKATQDSELSFWQEANKIYPIAKLRWYIAHPGDDGVSPTPDTLAVAKQLGIGMAPGDAGAMGVGSSSPLFGNIERSGVRMCLGVDAMNVAPYPPFGDLWYVTSGETQDPAVPGIPADQRLTRQQALDDRTSSCAWFFRQDDRLGRLVPGYHADLIVLGKDYFSVRGLDIRSFRSRLSVVDGRIVWASPRGPWAKLDPCYAAMGGEKWVDASKNAAIDKASC